jgi:predicted nucleotide-binding protein
MSKNAKVAKSIPEQILGTSLPNAPELAEDAPKRVRVSQADIPAYSLDEAMRVPKAIVDNYNSKPTAFLKVAAAMKIGPAASQFKVLTGAAIAYGLTDGGAQSDLITLTPLGLRIFKPKVEGDDLIAKREAFLKPRVIGQFLRQYDGGAVPKADIAENVLSGDMAVPEQRAAAIFNLILDGAKTLGLITTIKERPYVSLEGAGTGTSEEEMYDPAEPIEGLAEESEETPIKLSTPAVPAPAPAAPLTVVDQANKRVFITHGKNLEFLDPIKKVISFGKYEAVVAQEKQSVSKPVPDKVMGLMRSCGAAIIHVDVEKTLKDPDGNDVQVLNPNVLTEIGAAMALYGRRFILLVKEGVKTPSNLQGLYEVRYSGDKLDANDAFKLLESMQDLQNHPIPDRYKEQ